MKKEIYSAKNMPKINLQVYPNSVKLHMNLIDRIVTLAAP